MNSSRCSSLVVGLVVLVAAVGAVGAVSVSDDDIPREAQVGNDVSATIELTQLFQNPSYQQWTLQGETELDNVTWTVQVVNQAGNQIDEQTFTGKEFGYDVNIESGAADIEVTVTGTVPPIANYTYDPAESFLLVELRQAQQGGTSTVIEGSDAHHYTEDSKAARDAMEDAQAAIDAAGGNQQAERTLSSAVSAYENENFQNAVDLANQAEDTASAANRSQSLIQIGLAVVGGLVLLGAVVGGVIYWRNSRTHSRL